MKTFLKNVNGIIIPNRAHDTDAGFDVVATSDPVVHGVKLELSNDVVAYKSIDYIEYQTDIHITPRREFEFNFSSPLSKTNGETRYHTLVFPRSSISKYNLILANSVGLIDEGFRDAIRFRFKYLAQSEDLRILTLNNNPNFAPQIGTFVNYEKIYKKGDRIGQLVFSETVETTFDVVDELPTSERGRGGFGSTG